ncbi:MAG TPA: rRNA methyltransferase, partial [Candidatus Limnocylindria bacterium]
MTTETRAERYRRARRDPELVVLEGFHALKHALRFGAEPIETVVVSPERVRRLCETLAPDLVERIASAITATVRADELARLVPRPPATGVVAIARRRTVTAADALAAPGPA